MPDWVVWLIALAGPAVLTGILAGVTGAEKRNYVFLYLGLIAVVGVLRGFWPALLAAVISFGFLDYFFVEPYYTFTISQPQDFLNLVVFVVTASLVGVLASRRRRALLESEALAQQLREVNTELVRLNKEQAEAAQAALRLARSEQQIRTLQEADRLRRERGVLRQPHHRVSQQRQRPPRSPCGRRRARRCDQQCLLLGGELALCARTRLFAQSGVESFLDEAPLRPIDRRGAHRDRLWTRRQRPRRPRLPENFRRERPPGQ